LKQTTHTILHKAAAFALAGVMVFSLAACGVEIKTTNTGETETATISQTLTPIPSTSVTETAEPSNPPAVTPVPSPAPGGGIPYSNKGLNFSLTLPVSWAGLYRADERSDGVSFIDVRNADAGYGGFIFGIAVSNDRSPEEWTGVLLAQNGGKYYYITTPSDVEYAYDDAKLTAEYTSMQQDVDSIKATFKLGAASVNSGGENAGWLIGQWHAMNMIAAGFAERYVFHSDGTFLYGVSEMNGLERVRYKKGIWSVSGDKLTLSVTSKLVLAGGDIAEADGEQYIENASVQNRVCDPPENKTLTVAQANPDPDTNRATITIGGVTYYNFDNQPDLMAGYDELLAEAENSPAAPETSHEPHAWVPQDASRDALAHVISDKLYGSYAILDDGEDFRDIGHVWLFDYGDTGAGQFVAEEHYAVADSGGIYRMNNLTGEYEKIYEYIWGGETITGGIKE